MAPASVTLGVRHTVSTAEPVVVVEHTRRFPAMKATETQINMANATSQRAKRNPVAAIEDPLGGASDPDKVDPFSGRAVRRGIRSGLPDWVAGTAPRRAAASLRPCRLGWPGCLCGQATSPYAWACRPTVKPEVSNPGHVLFQPGDARGQLLHGGCSWQ
jgi:hypothetical protein